MSRSVPAGPFDFKMTKVDCSYCTSVSKKLCLPCSSFIVCDLQEVDSIKLEVEELKKEISSYEEQLKTVEETIEQFQKQLEELQEKGDEAKVKYSDPSL